MILKQGETMRISRNRFAFPFDRDMVTRTNERIGTLKKRG